MLLITKCVLLSGLASLLITFMRWFSWRYLPLLKLFGGIPFTLHHHSSSDQTAGSKSKVKNIMEWAEYHETAARLDELVQKDGAGCWPPRANHEHSTWPAALRPYKEIYQEMAPLLPAADISLDDEVNKKRITYFRSHFRKLLGERVNLSEVTRLFEAAEAGRWDVFPRDTYNAVYCCIAWCRHAYR